MDRRWKILPFLIWICLLSSLLAISSGQRLPPPPPKQNPNSQPPPQQQPPPPQQNPNPNLQKNPNPKNPLQNLNQNQNGSNSNPNIQLKREELANVKDENIKRVLLELSTLLTPSQMAETLARVAQLIGPLFYNNFEQRKEHIILQGRNASQFPQRLMSAFTDIQGEEVKALVLQKNLETLHAADFGFLPMAFLYALQDSVLQNISATKLASAVKFNRGDTTIAYKSAQALSGRRDQQVEFLQSFGTNILPDVQKILIQQVLQWWGSPNQWKDRELSLLTSSGDPLLAYLPPSTLETLDDEQADRIISILGQSNEIGKSWWTKPMSLKKAWFELAKGARYFGAVHEWSFRRMQKLSFLLEGASPEDLELIPPIPEIKGLVISNHYTELQARVVFNAFYKKSPLSQEDLQEFQFHILSLIPSQLQRFDLADSFSTLDDMMVLLENQRNPSYSTLLQISYFMWPVLNTTNGLTMAQPGTWQKRELSQMGKLLFLLPKSTLFQIPPDLINWDSNALQGIRSKHLSTSQIWFLTSTILSTIDDRFKPDYVFLIPTPFQKGIPTQNISQALLGSSLVRPEVLRALIEESEGMLTSQKAVIIQRIRPRLSEATIIRNIVSSSNPSDLFELFSPRLISKTMPAIIKTILEMPESGRFGITSIQAKLLPRTVLSLWLNWVREQAQVTRWTAEDLLGRSAVGATHAVNLAILGLSCRDVKLIDPLDILPVILHYRHELYALRNFRPELNFQLNLRPCLLDKVVKYLKIKRNLNGNSNSSDSQDGHILSELNPGEISGIGGEILSLIPIKSLDTLQPEQRIGILEEIGRIGTVDLFHFVPLEQLQWYGNTLFKDIQIQRRSQKTKRQAVVPAKATTATTAQVDPAKTNPTNPATTNPDPTNPDAKASDPTNPNPTASDPADPLFHGAISGRASSDQDQETDATKDSAASDVDQGQPDPDPTQSQQSDPLTPRTRGSDSSFSHQPLTIDLDSIQKLGNLFCYASDLFVGNWSTQLLQDTLESKSTPGEKTCCISAQVRAKWFTLLQNAYGADTSSWNEFDLAAIGDLLVTLPEIEISKISKDSLAQAVHPILKQSGYDRMVLVPGAEGESQRRKQRFISVCGEALGPEGTEMVEAYKRLMRKLAQGAQWLVSSVKNTDDLIKGSLGRTGRLPRWAEFTLVRKSRQIPISTGTTQPKMEVPVAKDQFMFPGGSTAPMAPNPAPVPVAPAPIAPQQTMSSPTGSMSTQIRQIPTTSQSTEFQFPGDEQMGSQGQGSLVQTMPSMSKGADVTMDSIEGRAARREPFFNQAQDQFSGKQGQIGYQGQQGQFGSQKFDGIQGQGKFDSLNQGKFDSLGQGKFDPPGQGKFDPPGQGKFDTQYSQGQGKFGSLQGQSQFGAQGQTQFSPQSIQGQGQFGSQGQFGNLQGQSQFGAQGQGQFGSQGQGQFGSQGQGQFGSQGQSQFDVQKQVQFGNLQGQGQFGSQGQSQFDVQKQVQFGNLQGQGQFGSQGQGQFGSQGQGQFGSQGQSQFDVQKQVQFGNLQGQGQFGAQEQGKFGPAQGYPGSPIDSKFGMQGQTQYNPQADQGKGQFGIQKQGQFDSQGQFGSLQGQGQFGGQGQSQFGPSQVEGQFGAQGQGQLGSLQGQGQFGGQGQSQFGPQGAQGQGQFGVQGQGQLGPIQGQGQFGVQSQFNSGQTLDLTARGLNASSNGTITTDPNQPSVDAPVDERTRDLGSDAAPVPTPSFSDNGQQDQITCHGVKAAGHSAIGLTIEDLQKLTANDLFDCIEPLGKLDWEEVTKTQILSLLTQKVFLDTNKLSRTLTLVELGQLVTALKSSDSSNANSALDVSKMDLTIPRSLDILSILGSKITDPTVLKALAEKFNTDNKIFPGFSIGIARPENLRIAVLSLGNIICGFSDKIVNSIFESDASLFIDCSTMLGKLEGCSMEVLSTLATHAVRPSNYGPPRLWTQEDLETIGVVFAGLKSDLISTIPSDSMQGLQPHAIKSLPTSSFLALTSDQISRMSYDAANSVLSSQLNSLSPNQLDALKGVVQVQNEEFNVEVDPDDSADLKVEQVRGLSDGNGTDLHTGRAKGEGHDTGSTTSTEAPPSSTHAPESEGETGSPKGGTGTSGTSGANRNLYYPLFAMILPLIVILRNI